MLRQTNVYVQLSQMPVFSQTCNMEEDQKLYNWLHLTAGHAMMFFANISGPRRDKTLWSFRQSETQTTLLIYID